MLCLRSFDWLLILILLSTDPSQKISETHFARHRTFDALQGYWIIDDCKPILLLTNYGAEQLALASWCADPELKLSYASSSLKMEGLSVLNRRTYQRVIWERRIMFTAT